MDHRIQLTIESGREITVYDQYAVTIDMLSPGSAWTFAFWHSMDPQSPFDVLQKEVKAFDGVQLRIDGALQLSGIIEEIDEQDDRGKDLMTISGRDLAGVAIDAEADPRISLRNTSLEDVLTALYEQIGATVIVGADADAARAIQQTVRQASFTRSIPRKRRPKLISRAHPMPGERIWQLGDRFARKLGYMVWTAPVGGKTIAVIVDKPQENGPSDYQFIRTAEYVGDVVRTTGNIVSARWKLSVRNTPTAVSVMSQPERGSNAPARFAATSINGLMAAHPRIADHGLRKERFIRPRRAVKASEAQREAERVLAEANAGLETYECTVRGHGQDNKIYAVNSICYVRDELRRIDQQMLTHRVTFNGDRNNGQTTTLTMAPLGAIKVIPESDVA